MPEIFAYMSRASDTLLAYTPPWWALVSIVLGTALVFIIGFIMTCPYRVLVVREVMPGLRRAYLDWGRIRKKQGGVQGMWLVKSRKAFEPMPQSDAHIPFGPKWLVIADMDTNANLHWRRYVTARTTVRTVIPTRWARFIQACENEGIDEREAAKRISGGAQ